MTAKRKPEAFTSFRVIGKKAQNILERARKTLKEKNGNRDPAPAPLPHRKPDTHAMVHLSVLSIVKATFAILAILLGMTLLYILRDKFILLLLAVFVAVIIDPGVSYLERFRVPRGVGVLVHYLVVMFLLLFLLFSFIPIVAAQLQSMAELITNEANVFLANPQIALPMISDDVNMRLTNLVRSTLENLSIEEFTDALETFGQNLSTAAQGSLRLAAQVAGSFVTFLVSLIVVLVLAFFIQMEKEMIVKWLRGFVPLEFRDYVDSKSDAIHRKISQWVRGQLLLCLSIFLLTLLALVILRMPYALTLAALAGFCELIPAVGPFIAAVPAVLIAFTQEGMIWGFVLMGIYYVIQLCENNLLVPLIMRRAVSLSPIAILFAMMVGISFPETLHPVLGVMISIPTTTIIALFLEDWRVRAQ